MESLEEPILKVLNLNKQFGNGCEKCNESKNRLKKNFCSECGTVYACQDISFDLYKGEILGVVGESGSGKSTMMECLYFDKEVTSGELYIRTYKNGKVNIFSESSQQRRFIKNNILGKVYQSPIQGLRMNFSSIVILLKI